MHLGFGLCRFQGIVLEPMRRFTPGRCGGGPGGFEVAPKQEGSSASVSSSSASLISAFEGIPDFNLGLASAHDLQESSSH